MQKIEILPNQRRKLNAILNRFKNYEKFSSSKRHAYEFTRILGIRVCPYCNINYTYTVFEKTMRPDGARIKKTCVCRPDLDHFEAKFTASGKKKCLALDNLIPSCQQCNSRIKGRKQFNSTSHLHPFQDDFDTLVKFSIKLKKVDYLAENNFDIDLQMRSRNIAVLTSRAKKTIDDFKLVSRYQYHKSDVVDILEKAKFYHAFKIKEIARLISGGGTSYFSAVSSLKSHLGLNRVNEINHFPLSKLRNDVVDIVC